MKEVKKNILLTFYHLDIDVIDHYVDYQFGTELIPYECHISHYYDKKGNYYFKETNVILN